MMNIKQAMAYLLQSLLSNYQKNADYQSRIKIIKIMQVTIDQLLDEEKKGEH